MLCTTDTMLGKNVCLFSRGLRESQNIHAQNCSELFFFFAAFTENVNVDLTGAIQMFTHTGMYTTLSHFIFCFCLFFAD